MSRRRNRGSQEPYLPHDREIIAGIDSTYHDPRDEFWTPIRVADERDKAAREQEVKDAGAKAVPASKTSPERRSRGQQPKSRIRAG
jgi:hypothetical protein